MKNMNLDHITARLCNYKKPELKKEIKFNLERRRIVYLQIEKLIYHVLITVDL